jgi:hypothetical protein
LDSISQLQEIGVRPMIPLPSLCNDKSAYADGMCREPCGIGRCRAMHRIGNANTLTLASRETQSRELPRTSQTLL